MYTHDNTTGAVLGSSSGGVGSIIGGNFDSNDDYGISGEAEGLASQLFIRGASALGNGIAGYFVTAADTGAADVSTNTEGGSLLGYELHAEDSGVLTGFGNSAAGDADETTLDRGFDLSTEDTGSLTLTASTSRFFNLGMDLLAEEDSSLTASTAPRRSARTRRTPPTPAASAPAAAARRAS